MKFKVGDCVKVVNSGSGCGDRDKGQTVRIVEAKVRGYSSLQDGYKVYPPIGNTLTGLYGGWIGESTFELTLKTVRNSTLKHYFV